MRQAGLHAVEGAIKNDGSDRAPFSHRHFVERLLCAHGSIVDQNVDAAEMRRGGGDQLFDRGSVGDVGYQSNGLATCPDDLAGDILRLIAVAARIDHDRCAAVCERERDPAPDIAPGAGDDGDLSR